MRWLPILCAVLTLTACERGGSLSAQPIAIVTSLTAEVETGLGIFTNALETFEENPLEPDSLNEFKYYVAGIGMILEVNADSTEYVPLVEVT